MDAMRRVMERLEGRCSQAELVEVRSRKSSVSSSNNSIKAARTTESAGYALRVIAGGRLGFATATSLDNPDTIVDFVLETAPFGEPVDFELAGNGKTPVDGLFYEKTAHMHLEEQADFLSGLCDRVKRAYPKGIVEGQFSIATDTIRVVTTQGQDAGYQRTRCQYGVSSQLALEGDIRFGGDDWSGVAFEDVSERISQRIAEQMTLSERVASIKSGPTDVVFVPQVVPELLWPLMESLNGDAVVRKTSPLAGKIGEPLFGPEFNLIDDGTLAASPLSASIDDEGTPTTRRSIVKDGVLQGYLLDRRSAAALKMQPTGNGLKLKMLSPDKNLEGMPQGAPTNWIIPPGKHTTDEMIASIDDGLYLLFLGGTHSANHLGGQVAGNVYLGFKIERGKLVGRVKNAMLSTNAFDALKGRIAAVSSDVELVGHIFVPAGFLMPAMHISGVDIAAGS